MALKPLAPSPDRNALVLPSSWIGTKPWLDWFRDVYLWIVELGTSAASLLAAFLVQHNANGTHGAVTATSVTASGAVSGATVTASGAVSGATVTATTAAFGKTTVGTAIETIIFGSLTANTNDWAPAGLTAAGIVSVSATTPVNLTGLLAQEEGRSVTFAITGANAITFVNQSGLSVATNSFFLGAGGNRSKSGGTTLTVKYVNSRWRLVGES